MRKFLLTILVLLLAFTAWVGLSVMMPFVEGVPDSDGDGIPDSIDLYPFDRDNDGIRDSWDEFPDYDAALKVDLHTLVPYSQPFGLEEVDIQIMVTVNEEITTLGLETTLNMSTVNETVLNLAIVVDIPDDENEGTLSFAVLAIHPTDVSLNYYLNLDPDLNHTNISYIFTASPALNVRASTVDEGDEELVDASLNFTVRAVALSIDQTLSWEFEGQSHEIILNIKMHEFYYYDAHNIPRYYTINAEIRTFITAEDEIVDRLAQNLMQLFLPNWTEAQKAGLVLAMVQSLEYETDENTSGHSEYWSFPVETLFRGNGDCEDTSFLLASLYKNLGYQSAILLYFPPADSGVGGHMAGAVALTDYEGFYYNLRSGDYYYAETTGEGWMIGEIPEDYVDFEPIIVRA